MSFVAKVRTARHLRAVIYGIVLFGALGVWSEIASWNAHVERVSSQMAETAKAIGNHVDDVVEVARQPLAALALDIHQYLDTPLASLSFISEMRVLAANSGFIRSLAYVRADGRLVESTLSPLSSGIDLAYRDYFQFHKSSPSLDTRIGSPAFGPVAQDWFVTVSRRVNAPDGTFAGVLLATIKVDHFADFFKGYDLGPGRSMLLADSEGTVMLRLPLDAPTPVSSIAQSRFFRERLVAQPYGSTEYVSPFDGELRIGGYFRSPETGVTTTVGVAKKVIFFDWVHQVAIRWIFALVAFAAAIFLGIRWQRQSWMRQRSEAQTAAREAEFRVIANASSDLIEKLDAVGIREYVSPSSRGLLEREPEELVGRPVSFGYGAEVEAEWDAALVRVRNGATAERLISSRRSKSGEIIWLESLITRTADAGGMAVVTRNITPQRKLQEKLDRLAKIDELTRVFNKRHFNEALAELAAPTQPGEGRPFSLLLADVDRFKAFNDTYGHVPGDACLQRIASTIQGAVRARYDTVARYGGEEFAILLPGVGADGARLIAEKIREAVFKLEIEHRENAPWGQVTISLGCATFDWQAGCDANGLVVQADQALYRAKSEARNAVRVYQDAAT